ncbi:MAG: hypothetical protein JWM93_3566, partial [Frankiales bacterium]|nr:hypothetical protein [Frankiales bacterium]
PADAGRTIRAVVSAAAPGQLPGTARSAPVRIGRATSSLRVSVSSLGRRIVVAPSLRLPGTATAAVSATVRIYVDGRLRTTLRTTRGKARYRTAAVARGRHRVTVTYAGSTAYRPDSGKVSLTTR